MHRLSISLGLLGFVACASAATPAHAIDQPIDGLKIMLMRSAAGKQKLAYESSDPMVLFPDFGSADDPRAAGVLIDVISPVENLNTLTIPPGDPAWKVKSGEVDVYVYRSPTSSGSVVRKIVLRRGSGLKILARGTALEMASAHGQVGFRVQLGSLRNCTWFAAGSVAVDVPGRFIAYNAIGSAIGDCESQSLGAPHIYCDVVTPCPAGQFCEMEPGICASGLDAGTCVDASPNCPDVYDPECGCDGVTYGNRCERRAAKVQPSHDGACEECVTACDCYETQEFQEDCPLLCPSCGSYWTCEKNLCVENCGPLPGPCEDL